MGHPFSCPAPSAPSPEQKGDATHPSMLDMAITSIPATDGADLALLEAAGVFIHPSSIHLFIPVSLSPRRALACCCGTLADPRLRCSLAARLAWAGPTWPWPWAPWSSTTTEELPRSLSKPPGWDWGVAHSPWGWFDFYFLPLQIPPLA